MPDQAQVEAYGSARLETAGAMDMTGVFGSDGSTVMPLGWSSNGRSGMGYGYSVGPKGPHKGHAITFGRTRGGKGVSSIMPALLTYSGSMVVLDPKGENAWTTAERRRQLGHRVVILDPWGEVNRRYGSKAGVAETVTKFNPLSALDPGDADFHDDVMAIAEALIFQTGSDPHWSDSARELTGGLIAAEVQNNAPNASTQRVRQLLRSSIQRLNDTIEDMLSNFPNSVASAKLAPLIEMSDKGEILNGKELASIRSVARTQTGFLDSARLIESMETDEAPFNLGTLGAEKVTLFLVLPVDRLQTHGRWLRMILTLAIRAIARLETAPDLPVVFLLDELGTISPGSGLRMIEQSFGLMAGLGIRIWAFLQDLPQLKRDYPESWETFISNSSVIQLLNVNDSTTAEYFSRHLGQSTINAKTGEWLFRHKPWEGGMNLQEYKTQFEERFYMQLTGLSADIARKVMREGFNPVPMPFPNQAPRETQAQRDARVAEYQRYENLKVNAVSHAATLLRDRGDNFAGYHEWEPATQLMPRSLLLPYEIIKAKPDECVVIVSDEPNRLLKRYVYYKDPKLKGWARPDLNRPQPSGKPEDVAAAFTAL